MFKFNVSEEFIFSIKNGSYLDRNFSNKNSYLFDDLLKKFYGDRVLIICGFDNSIRDDICTEIIYRFFINNCDDRDMNVFNLNSIEELDEIYLEDRFQLFYLNDIFGKVSLNIERFKFYLNKITSSKNKFLILNIRELSKDIISNFKSCEDLNFYKDEIIKILGKKYKERNLYLEESYSNFSYIEKFIIFSILFNNIEDIDVWIRMTERYFLSRNILNENSENLIELILKSFKSLENDFIYVDEYGKFSLKNLMGRNFLITKLKFEEEIVRDLFNNINSYFNLKELVGILKNLNLKLVYEEHEYDDFLRGSLFEKICLNTTKNIVELLEVSSDLFSIIGIEDSAVIENLNTKMIYSSISMENAIKYLRFVKNNKSMVIHNKIFKDKLLSLIYNYNSLRGYEFYNYGFKYFSFVSEFYSVYDDIDEEEFLDIKRDFDRLIDIISNNANSYFTLEYFSLNNEIKQALIDLKFLIDEFNIENIFFHNVYEIFNSMGRNLMELFNYAVEFIPENKQDYYTLTYFENEIERNREFLEATFETINLENISQEIKKNIYNFKA